jgi:hypothetical protein
MSFRPTPPENVSKASCLDDEEPKIGALHRESFANPEHLPQEFPPNPIKSLIFKHQQTNFLIICLYLFSILFNMPKYYVSHS